MQHCRPAALKTNSAQVTIGRDAAKWLAQGLVPACKQILQGLGNLGFVNARWGAQFKEVVTSDIWSFLPRASNVMK